MMLYHNVMAAGGKNFVTLAFDNTHCGQAMNNGNKTFPDTPALRAEFAAYAAAVVRQVPDLGGVSIWNEMNGSFGGGFLADSARLDNYCLLTNQVIAAVRAVDTKIPIAIGATIGPSISGWFTGMFDTFGCSGKGDQTIWLDVHPYLTGKTIPFEHETDFQLWNDNIAAIRADNITNPLIATEWGGPAAAKFQIANPARDYVTTFKNKVIDTDKNWAALSWFPWKSDNKNNASGLLDQTGTELTTLGTEYIAVFKN